MFQTKLKSAFEKVRQDKKVLEKNLSEVELETKFLQEDNQNLESKLSSRATEVEKLEEDLKAEKESKHAMEIKLNKLQSESEEKFNLIKVLLKEKEALTREVKSKTKVNNSQTNQVLNLEKEVHRLKEEMVKQKKSMVGKSDLTSLQREFEALKSKHEETVCANKLLDQSRDALLKLNEENKEHQQDLEISKRCLEDGKAVLQSELQSSLGKNAALTRSVQQLNKTIQEHKESASSWERKYELGHKELVKLQIRMKDIVLQQQTSKASDEELERLKAKILTLKSQIAGLDEKLLEEANSRAKAEARLVCRADELSAMSNKNVDAETRLRDVETEVRQKSNEIGELKSKLDNFEDRHSHMQQTLKMRLADVHKLKTEASAMKKEIEKLSAGQNSRKNPSKQRNRVSEKAHLKTSALPTTPDTVSQIKLTQEVVQPLLNHMKPTSVQEVNPVYEQIILAPVNPPIPVLKIKSTPVKKVNLTSQIQPKPVDPPIPVLKIKLPTTTSFQLPVSGKEAVNKNHFLPQNQSSSGCSSAPELEVIDLTSPTKPIPVQKPATPAKPKASRKRKAAVKSKKVPAKKPLLVPFIYDEVRCSFKTYQLV